MTKEFKFAGSSTAPETASRVDTVVAPAAPPVDPELPLDDDENDPTAGTLTLAAAQPTERPRAFYVASQWHIMPGEQPDTIEATHSQTNDHYIGPVADFNEMLRGN